MEIIDISMPVKGSMVCWEDKFPPEIVQYGFLSKGDLSNASYMKADLHVGTHVDAPYHFLPQGKKLEQLNLTSFIGECYVAEISGSVISGAALDAANIPQTQRLLFKTSNHQLYEQKKFSKNYVALDETGAQWLAQRQVVLAGVDYLSVELYHNQTFPAHRILLQRDVVLLEGLYLKHVQPGRYFLSALPVRVEGVEAAPVRAVLLPHNVVR